MINVLSRAAPSHLRHAPFPHLVVQEALDPRAYSALAASFPAIETLTGRRACEDLASNRRYSTPAWPLMLREDVAPIWKMFLQQHVSQAFLDAVFTIFAGCWDQGLLDMLDRGDRKAGLLYRDSHQEFRVLADARVEINSPVRGPASSPRGAHLDAPNRLFSGLFYLRDGDDDSVGGELELFRWASRPSEALDVFELPAHAVERVATIPYRPNQLVLFPQSVFALHGVGIRQPTPHIRRYVFITAEIEDDWLTSYPTSPAASDSSSCGC